MERAAQQARLHLAACERPMEEEEEEKRWRKGRWKKGRWRKRRRRRADMQAAYRAKVRRVPRLPGAQDRMLRVSSEPPPSCTSTHKQREGQGRAPALVTAPQHR